MLSDREGLVGGFELRVMSVASWKFYSTRKVAWRFSLTVFPASQSCKSRYGRNEIARDEWKSEVVVEPKVRVGGERSAKTLRIDPAGPTSLGSILRR